MGECRSVSTSDQIESSYQPIFQPPGLSWQNALSGVIRDVDTLFDRLDLPEASREDARTAAETFPLVVPESYLARMQPGDVDDPLLRQVLPLGDELLESPGFSPDPVGDADAKAAAGLLQKYNGRALLITTGACAVHCRYCFRRAYSYGEEPRRLDDWEPAFAAITADTSLEEIILSGGDPLMLTDRRLTDIITRLEAIPHLRRLRIHTRLPIVLPSRMTDDLIRLLVDNRLTTVVVVHANHANELVADCADALRTLSRTELTVLNQTVLLRGINDDAETLADLSTRLIDLGVIPYYLHQLDRVTGAAHFEVPEERGRELIETLRRRLPGYAVPRYVREVAGEPFKMPLP
jgi:EF-P beta-lysylation protein EpmB